MFTIFNVFGIVGGFLSPAIGRRTGLRRSSAIGFAVAFLVLLTLGLFSDSMPLWASLLVPALFILCHSGGLAQMGKAFHHSLFAVNCGQVPTVWWGRLAQSVRRLGCLFSPSSAICTACKQLS